MNEKNPNNYRLSNFKCCFKCMHCQTTSSPFYNYRCKLLEELGLSFPKTEVSPIGVCDKFKKIPVKKSKILQKLLKRKAKSET